MHFDRFISVVVGILGLQGFFVFDLLGFLVSFSCEK